MQFPAGFIATRDDGDRWEITFNPLPIGKGKTVPGYRMVKRWQDRHWTGKEWRDVTKECPCGQWETPTKAKAEKLLQIERKRFIDAGCKVENKA